MMPPSGKPLVGKSMPRRLAPLRIGSGTGGLASLRVRRHGVARAMPTRLRCFGRLRAGRSAPMADELIAWPDWGPCLPEIPAAGGGLHRIGRRCAEERDEVASQNHSI